MLTDLQRRKFTDLFNCIDFNRDGYLEASDFERLAERLARGFIPAAPLGAYQTLGNFWQTQWRSLQQAAGTENPQQISLAEWLTLIEQHAQHPRRLAQRAIRQFIALRKLIEPDRARQPCTARQVSIWFCALNYDLRFAPLTLHTLDTDRDGLLVQSELIERCIEWLGSDSAAPGNWLFGPMESL